MHWMILPLKRYFDFGGRSRRREYWMFALFSVLLTVGFYVTMIALAGGFASFINRNASSDGTVAAAASIGVVWLVWVLVILAFIIPSIAVAVRRLHDTNRRGWWLLAPVLPLAVIISVIIRWFGRFFGNVNAATPIPADDAVGPVIGICFVTYLIASVVMLVLMCIEGTSGTNRFGPDPKRGREMLNDVFR